MGGLLRVTKGILTKSLFEIVPEEQIKRGRIRQGVGGGRGGGGGGGVGGGGGGGAGGWGGGGGEGNSTLQRLVCQS